MTFKYSQRKIFSFYAKKVSGKNVNKITLWKISLFIRSSSFRKQ